MGSSRVGSNPTRSVIFNYFDNVDKIDHLHCVTTSFPWTGRHCAAMAEWLRRLTRNQMGSSRVGSNPTRSVGLAQILERLQHRRKWSALSGNRTPVSRVAGENSTTEPTMRGVKSKSNLSNRIALFTYLLKKILHCRGIEPRSPAWQARILPLNQQCSGDTIRPVQVNISIFQEDV